MSVSTYNGSRKTLLLLPSPYTQLYSLLTLNIFKKIVIGNKIIFLYPSPLRWILFSMICRIGQLQSQAESSRPSSVLKPTASSRSCQNQPQFPCARGNSQNSLKTIMLMVTIYYPNGMQIKNNEGKKCMGQSPGDVPNIELPLFSPHGVRIHYSTSYGLWQ